MPIYEYKCYKCNNILEKFATLSDFDRTPTTICGCGCTAHRIISLQCQPDYGFQKYNTEDITGYPAEITSHGHQERLLKENGLHQVAPGGKYGTRDSCNKFREGQEKLFGKKLPIPPSLNR